MMCVIMCGVSCVVCECNSVWYVLCDIDCCVLCGELYCVVYDVWSCVMCDVVIWCGVSCAVCGVGCGV